MMNREMLRVLCVEDEPLDRQLIRHALEEEAEGFEILEATDRKSFESHLEGSDFDVVLTDFNILGFEGLDVIHAVTERRPDTPVIVVTGTGSEEVAVRSLKEGAADYVIKTPRHIAQLPMTVQRALDAKNTRDRVRELDANLRALVDNTADGILVVDDQRRIVFSNPVAAELLGRDSKGLVGRTFEHPVAEVESVEIELPQRSTGSGVAEMRVAKTTWNKQVSHIVSLRDITERKRAEAERAQIELQYHQAQRLESVGRLAGGIAHDLNNLLSPILGYGEMLLEDAGKSEPNRGRVQEILNAATRARDLVRQLLMFSRKQMLEFKAVDLNDLLRNMENLVRGTGWEDVDIRMALTPSLPPIKGNVGQMEQIIMNLIVNAQDAMPDGGNLTIETHSVEQAESHTADPGGEIDGPHVLLVVRDTGCGMDAETLPHVFEPFYTTKEKDRGTGLGLAIVYSMVKQHGGTIQVFSKPGHGTTVEVRLPVSNEPVLATEKNERTPAGIPCGGSETILVVEDNEQVRNLAITMLEKQGYKVLAASSGQEALALLESRPEPVHLLLTDVIMPDMNGKQLYQKVSGIYPEIKAIYMSGYTDDLIARRGMMEEGVHFVQKPFSVKALAEKVREVLYGARTKSAE